MTNCPIVMKRLYDLALSINMIEQMTIIIEFATANSRNTRADGEGEHWKFQSRDAVVQLRAVNCCNCGNYKKRFRDTPLPDKIRCECDIGHCTTKAMIAQIVNSERMDAFINIERNGDLLCEDVVGLILEYL
jgi:hypothetical protein